MDTTNWHIFRTQSGHEIATAQACGVTAYVPHKLARFYNRRQRVTVTRRQVMLPGFVFIHCAQPRDVKIPGNRHRYGFMRLGNMSFARLDPRAMALLMDLEREMCLDFSTEHRIDAPEPGIKSEGAIESRNVCVGSMVVIARPMFKGLKALVTEIRGDAVLAEIVDASYSITLNKGDLLVT